MSKATKYTIGGALTGLAGALLIRKLVSSNSAPMTWKDYLLWGGGGATLGGMLGRGMVTVDTEKLNTDQADELKKEYAKLSEESNQIKANKKDKVTAISALWPYAATLPAGLSLGFSAGRWVSEGKEIVDKLRDRAYDALQQAKLTGKKKSIARAQKVFENVAQDAINSKLLSKTKWLGATRHSLRNLIGPKTGGAAGTILAGLGTYLLNRADTNKWLADPDKAWFNSDDDARLSEISKRQKDILKSLNKGN